MKCPNGCNDGKFVGLETGEPEQEQTLELSVDREGAQVTGSFRVTRNCTECGEALKEATLELSDDLPEDVFKAHNGEDHELSVDLEDATADESGGGRYAKNLITVTVNYSVTCKCDKEFAYDGQVETDSCAASSFEEC